MIESYRGNPNIRRSGSKIEWTTENVMELAKCAADPIWFIENYVYINDVDQGMVKFKLRDYQREMVLSMVDNRKSVFNCGRQIGKTASYVGFVLWYIIYHPDKTVAVMADKESTAVDIFSRINLAYQMLPPFLCHGVKKANETSLYLENNSRVFTSTTTPNSLRGRPINCLILDECAHIPDFENFWAAVRPTISSGKTTKVILSSTPNGLNEFYRICMEAKDGKNDFHFLEYTWRARKDRDEEWYRSELIDLGERRFDQEHNVMFHGSSNTLISGRKLKELVALDTLYHDDQGLKQYQAPIKDHSYVMVVDVSHGKSLDYSAFSVIDVTQSPFIQVCTFRSNQLTPLDYADVIYRIAKAYFNAAILVECNDLGPQVAQSLLYDFDCENVLHTESNGRLGKKITLAGSSNTIDPGLRISPQSKGLGCAILKLLIEQNQLIINDAETIKELTTFSKKNNTYCAEKGKHDDLVMGLVLFAWLSDQEYFKSYSDINALMKMRERSVEESEEAMKPFGYIREDHNEPLPSTPESRAYERELAVIENQRRRDAWQEIQDEVDAKKAKVEAVMGKGYLANF